MAEPVLIEVPLHPCNRCGGASRLIWYAWRDPAYVAACTHCDAMQEGRAQVETIEAWQQAHPLPLTELGQREGRRVDYVATKAQQEAHARDVAALACVAKDHAWRAAYRQAILTRPEFFTPQGIHDVYWCTFTKGPVIIQWHTRDGTEHSYCAYCHGEDLEDDRAFHLFLLHICRPIPPADHSLTDKEPIHGRADSH